MIIARLMGGLGNQLFQYAAGCALAARHGVELRLDLRWFGDHPGATGETARTFDLPAFSLDVVRADEEDLRPFWLHQHRLFGLLGCPLLQRISPGRIWVDHAPGWNPAFLELGPATLLDGYFQHPKYFEDVSATLRDRLHLRERPDRLTALAAELAESESVCLQVRRTDFVHNPEVAAHHGACSAQYYRDAWTELRERVPAARGYVFTDDPEWAHRELAGLSHVHVVGSEWDGPHYLHKFHLMRSCRHHLIANSTFGWWAAWLAEHPEQVVMAPREWWRHRDVNQVAPGFLPANWQLR